VIFKKYSMILRFKIHIKIGRFLKESKLLKKGLSTSIRLARGDDELAACGQLGQKGRQA
jgi:adenine C2-methylase RlmN of 23S rRNA A2503 and tRNA A37